MYPEAYQIFAAMVVASDAGLLWRLHIGRSLGYPALMNNGSLLKRVAVLL